MLLLYIVFVVGLAGLTMAGIVEQRRHFQRLGDIDIRVLVNGIRGKSSVTRLCVGALRGGGFRAAGRTSGAAARFLSVDGTEEPVYRKFDIANVSEILTDVRQAADGRADAIVVECMAVDPLLQELCQEKLVRSTIGVVANVREDHLAEMGPRLEDVARSLSRSMPVGGVCVTAEREWLWVLREEAARRDCRLVAVDPEDLTDEEMEPFSWFAFKENVAIALAVAAELGIPRQVALAGMWRTSADPGSLTVGEYRLGERTLRFANILSANDPWSTLMNFRQLLNDEVIRPPIVTLINCRPDRLGRNRQMGSIVPDLLTEKLFVIGEPTASAIRGVPKRWRGPIVDLGGRRRDPDEILRRLLAEVEPETSVVAIGNIHGQGELLLAHMERLGSRR